MEIITQSPAWFIVLCILAGAAYAGALYFRDRFNRTYGQQLAILLGTLRFITVTLLAFFLLRPLIKSVDRQVEKPVIVIAQDNSSSLAIGKDSAYYRGAYLSELRALAASFGEEADVRFYSFGNEVQEGIDSIDFSGKRTNFSRLLDELSTRFSGRNLGAIIVASDGLYNTGSNPIHSYQKLNVPIYSIALGDTTVYKDLLIDDIAVNRLAFLGNRFPVAITVGARAASGSSATLTVSRKGSTLFSQVVSFGSEPDYKTISLSLDAAEPGLQQYTVTLSAIEGEITLVNNRRDFFIDVLDGRQKILLLAQAPHPDLAAIAEAIRSNENYSVETALVRDFSGPVANYSLVIAHQLPSVGNGGMETLRAAIGKQIPVLFVWGGATDFRAFEELQTGFSLRDARPASTDAGGALAEGFSLFTLEETTRQMVRSLPPLTVPFGEIGFGPGTTPFIQQRIGQIQTGKPLIAFSQLGDTRCGLIAGEGIWRWKLDAYLQTEDHAHFNELVTKMVQFLSSREDRSLFRVSGPNDVAESDPVIFSAEVYNASYEAISDQQISMNITDAEGREYSFAFSPSGSRYRLNAGLLPVGNYRYTATVNSSGQVLTETGEFSVSPLQLEETRTIADHRLLYQLAAQNGGTMVLPSEMATLRERILAQKGFVSVSYESRELSDLINYSWLLGLLLFLLSLEWLLRKRAGTY